MKILKTGFMLFRNKSTESLQPFIFKTIARCVFFPDGKNLLQKWDEDIDTSLLVKHEYEDRIAENKSIYRWSCSTYEGEKYQVTGNFQPNILPSTKTSIVGPGKVGTIHRYKFEVPLPVDFKKNNTVDYKNKSTVVFSEGEKSTFVDSNTMHTIKMQKKDDRFVFLVDHYYGQDQIDLSGLRWVTLDINIIVDGMFIIYSTGANGSW